MLRVFRQSHLRGPGKAGEGKDVPQQIVRKEQKTSTDWEADLQKQLQLWRADPYWGDQDQPPEINVRINKENLTSFMLF